MAYVEVKAKTVELAIEAAMRELGVGDKADLDIEVMQEPERGFLGFGGQDAIVKVQQKRQGRGRSRKGGRKSGNSGGGSSNRQRSSQGKASTTGQKPKNGANKSKSQRSDGKKPERRHDNSNKGQRMKKDDDRDDISAEQQAELVEKFLSGLVTAFGLEGGVEGKVEDEVVIVDVTGDQTEALVGNRGAVMEAVHELSKTVLQRSARDSARVRLDIAGYAERRRQALTIYAADLIEQVVEDGGELMLEPMSASDRKVIHDAVGQHDGVRSYSEGESPKRYVVIAATSGDDGGEEE